MENKSNEASFFDERPQRLCRMCGDCCRVATTSVPYKEIKLKSEKGHAPSQEFLKIFEPFESIDAAKKVNAGIVENVLKRVGENEDEITFYSCRYLKDNMCSIYLERPKLCMLFPSSPWSICPPNCGYSGWLFNKREELKQRIRKLKEEIIHWNVQLNKQHDSETTEKIKLVLEKLQENLQAYGELGPTDF